MSDETDRLRNALRWIREFVRQPALWAHTDGSAIVRKCNDALGDDEASAEKASHDITAAGHMYRAGCVCEKCALETALRAALSLDQKTEKE